MPNALVPNAAAFVGPVRGLARRGVGGPAEPVGERRPQCGERVDHDLGTVCLERRALVEAPFDADGADARRPRHRHIVGGIADQHRAFRLRARFRKRIEHHLGMRLRGRVVRRLDGGEHRGEIVAGEELSDAAARLAGGDAEHDVVAGGEPSDRLQRTVEQGLVVRMARRSSR